MGMSGYFPPSVVPVVVAVVEQLRMPAVVAAAAVDHW